MSGYRINQFIQDVGRVPALRDSFIADSEKAFADFGLSEAEKAALRDGSPPALQSVGVHPILRVHWALMTNPALAKHFSTKPFFSRLKNGADHG